LHFNPVRRIWLGHSQRKQTMGIDTERDIEANLQIGPTDQGMVRLFIDAGSIEIPMDFEPDEALEIAEEIKAAADAARKNGARKGKRR